MYFLLLKYGYCLTKLAFFSIASKLFNNFLYSEKPFGPKKRQESLFQELHQGKIQPVITPFFLKPSSNPTPT